MEVSTDYFISLVECNRIIYDKSSKDFKNATKKDEAWARIAKITKTTVDAAKKRYTLLRQKYCREEQKMEIQRRTKSRPVNPWTYYDRFHFLDEYIRPRTTYSNDTGFEDVNGSSSRTADDTPMVSATEQASTNELNTEPELNDEDMDDGNIEFNDGGSSQQIIQYDPKDVVDYNLNQFVDISEEIPITVVSEYSGELSTYTPPAARYTTESDQIDVRANSSSTIADATRSLLGPPQDNGSGEDISQAQQNAEHMKMLGTIANAGRNLPRTTQNDGFQRTRENVSKRVPTTKLIAHHGRSTHKTVEPVSTVTSMPSNRPTLSSIPSNGQDTDSIRRKLDSCISSLSTKISEKHQRSPHAPFLAYLGTKLPNVPKEELSTLEKQILDLVDSFSH